MTWSQKGKKLYNTQLTNQVKVWISLSIKCDSISVFQVEKWSYMLTFKKITLATMWWMEFSCGEGGGKSRSK